ncbi:hypothetical protein BGW42_000062 [Actinomortierella wolfii]|nr:hypothetical protein BGW42_000062 [Actinomortierella wolfii]
MRQNTPDFEQNDYLCALVAQAMILADDRNKGQFGKAAVDSDAQYAIDLMLQESRELEQSLLLAKSLSECEPIPRDLLVKLTEQEMQELSDREYALQLSREFELEEEDWEEDEEGYDDDVSVSSSWTGSNWAGGSSRTQNLQASLSRTSKKAAGARAKNVRRRLIRRYFCRIAECASCNESERCYRAPCQHTYCLECAQSLYSHALSDRAYIPVRCCSKAFSHNVATACLKNSDDIDKYEKIKAEFENPSSQPAVIDSDAAHIAAQNGWKPCPRCGVIVDRSSGCVHMTCSMCKYEFCYTCMEVWKTCECELYPAVELDQILNERVGEDDPGADRHRLRNALRRHEEAHDWTYIQLRGQMCHLCGWRMPKFCYFCAECRETRCFRCAFNL